MDIPKGLHVTRCEGLGYIMKNERTRKISAPQRLQLWIDRSSSMVRSIRTTGPVIVQMIEHIYAALGSFDIRVLFFNSHMCILHADGTRDTDYVWEIRDSNDVRELCKGIQRHWVPSGRTNISGALVRGLSHDVDHVLVTSDGEFDERMTYENREYTREQIYGEFARVSVTFHFIGMNEGAGSDQLTTLRDAFPKDRKPNIYEFGEDTDVSYAVQCMFPEAYGAIQYAGYTIYPQQTIYCSDERHLDVPNVACTDELRAHFRESQRRMQFKQDIERALRAPSARYGRIQEILEEYGDVPFTRMMRSASSSLSPSGKQLHMTNIIANMRAASSQM